MFHRDFDISIAEYIEVYDKYLYKHSSFTNDTSLFTLLMEVSYNKLSQISNTFADQISLAMYENYLIHFLWLRRVFFTEGYLSGGSWAKDVCALSDFEPVFPKEIYKYFTGIGLLKIGGEIYRPQTLSYNFKRCSNFEGCLPSNLYGDMQIEYTPILSFLRMLNDVQFTKDSLRNPYWQLPLDIVGSDMGLFHRSQLHDYKQNQFLLGYRRSEILTDLQMAALRRFGFETNDFYPTVYKHFPINIPLLKYVSQCIAASLPARLTFPFPKNIWGSLAQIPYIELRNPQNKDDNVNRYLSHECLSFYDRSGTVNSSMDISLKSLLEASLFQYRVKRISYSDQHPWNQTLEMCDDPLKPSSKPFIRIPLVGHYTDLVKYVGNIYAGNF